MTCKTLVGYCRGVNPKSRRVLGWMAEGAVGQGDRYLNDVAPFEIRPGTEGVFYGTDRDTIRVLREHRKQGIPFYYVDNAYIGEKGTAYRVTKSALTAENSKLHPGANSKGRRWAELHRTVRPWRRGRHILVALQSQLYFNLFVGIHRNIWLDLTLREIRKHTDRLIITREKPGKKYLASLDDQLRNCHAVVTWNSTVAIRALEVGVPAFCLDPLNSFKMVCPSDLSLIEDPPRRARRVEMFRWLADNQWTDREIINGECWKAIR